MKLTRKQSQFVEEYMIDLNATQAAIRANYSLKTAGRIGQENLQKPVIQAAIQAAMQARAERTQISADRVLEEYAKIAFLDVREMYNSDGRLKEIHEMDEKVSACIAGMAVLSRTNNDGEKETTKKIKIADKLKALQDIGRHIGLFEKDKLKIPPVPPSLYIVLDEADESTDNDD